MSRFLSCSGSAVASGGATAFGLFIRTDFRIVCGTFAEAVFVVTMPRAVYCRSLIAAKTDYDSVSVDALCEVMVSVIHNRVVAEAKKVSYRMVHFADCFIRAGEVRS